MSYLGLFPVAVVLLTGAAFIFSYILAVLRDDVSPGFPYISDTGADRPESCIFGQLLNMSSFAAYFIMYIRYKAVQAIVRAVDGQESRWISRMNKLSMAMGITAAFGVSVVANFQENTVVEVVHFVGAFLAFGPGVLYCFLQAALSFQMYPRFNGKLICWVRLSIALLCVVTFITTSVSGSIAFRHWNTEPHANKDKFKWKPEDPGYEAHIISTVFEWLLSIGFFCFFLTYIREFNKFEMEVVTRPLVSHLDQRVERSVQISRSGISTPVSEGMEGHGNPSFQYGAGEPDERTKLLGSRSDYGYNLGPL